MHGYAQISVLSVGEGDTLLKVDPNDSSSRQRFAGIVKGLLRKGYVISVVTGIDEHGQETRARVTEFDPDTLEYLIEGTTPEEDVALQQRMKGQAAGGRRRRLPIAGTPADAVPPTAGGCAPELLWTTENS